MSVKQKAVSQKMPSEAFVSFDAKDGKIKLEIELDGQKTKINPTKVAYLVIDEDFSEISGIKFGASQDKSVKSNTVYGREQGFYKVRLNDGTNVGAGTWQQVKPAADLYGGKYTKFLFAILMKVQGTEHDVKINALLSKNETIAKISFHGWALTQDGAFHKSKATQDLGGWIVTIDGMIRTPKGDYFVPNFTGMEAKEGSPALTKAVALFDTKIQPYIDYIKGGGTMRDVTVQAVPDAEFMPYEENEVPSTPPSATTPGDFPTQEPPVYNDGSDDLPF